MKKRIAISGVTLIAGVFVVYLLEKYYFNIPLAAAVLIVIIGVWYVLHQFFTLALLDKQDPC